MKDTEKPKPQSNAFMKYSGMAVQFFVLIGLAAYGGQWLDAQAGTPKPYLTVLCILVVSVGYFIKLYRDLMK